ncbi:MAG: SUMF1/EgtB/PvdO family nonheme iron enzyme [Chloroflexota bacterium]
MPNQPTNQQIQKLHNALLNGFSTFSALQMLTRIRLNRDLEQIVPVQGRTLTEMTYDLIRVFAAEEGGLHSLMRAAQEAVPDNAIVRAVVQELGELEFAPLPLPEDFHGRMVIEGGIHIHVQNTEEALALQKEQQEREALLNGTFERLPFEPETVLIPGGPFWMGDNSSERFSAVEASMDHIDLADFRMGKFPITNRAYASYTQAKNQIVPPELGWDGQSPHLERLHHPVIGVTFTEALAYCAWLSSETGRGYQLPTEAHWEKAARTTDGRTYPWGDEWQDTRCNHGGSSTTAVDHYPAQNEYGCYDLVGNVREWTRSLWGERLREPDERYLYPWQDDERNAPDANAQIRRIWRGGSYMDKGSILRCAARNNQLPNSRGIPHKRYGFRVMMMVDRY